MLGLPGIFLAETFLEEVERVLLVDGEKFWRLFDAKAIAVAQRPVNYNSHGVLRQNDLETVAGATFNAHGRNTRDVQPGNRKFIMRLRQVIAADPCKQPRVGQVWRRSARLACAL